MTLRRIFFPLLSILYLLSPIYIAHASDYPKHQQAIADSVSKPQHISLLPSFRLKDLEGKTVDTQTLTQGNRPLILDFFTSWCKPCLRELSAIHEIYPDWQEETGVELIAISGDEGATSHKVRPLFVAHDWAFRALLDTNGDFRRALNVEVYPTTIIFDASGNEVYRHTGYTDGGEEEIIEVLRKLKK